MPRHSNDLRDFWQRFQRGVEVAVAGLESEQSLGVRDAFQRYLREVLRRPVPLAVVPQDAPHATRQGLASSDEIALEAAGRAAVDLRRRLGGEYQFYVACEAAIHTLDVPGAPRSFLRVWAGLESPLGLAFAASGSLELHEGWESVSEHGSHPGARREGGMLRAMTGGLVTRRSAVTEATLLALASSFHGRWEPEGVRPA